MTSTRPRIHASVQDLLTYECLMYYYTLPEYANAIAIDYGHVYVTFRELATSLRRLEKCRVHSHVINALCRKLFKERHPTQSGRHYFFSTIGDYLVHNDPKSAYLYNNCKRSFMLANQCKNFKSCDYLYFPILYEGHWFVFIAAIRDGYFVFLDSLYNEHQHYQTKARSIIISRFVKAWNEFVGIDCDFEDFSIHYAEVPKLSMDYWSPFDDGIFTMKYLELWDFYVNMMSQFDSSNISDIRVKYVTEMVITPHNRSKTAQELLKNFNAMNKLRHPNLQDGTPLAN